MENIIKIGGVELIQNEAFELYQQQKYIVTYSKIYQLFYSQAQKRVYGQEVYYQQGLARRGRFYTMTAQQINHILGFELLKTV